MTLPSCLLNAIAAEERGKVVIVVGAGCSLEEPTNLPLAGTCSEDAHRKLVNDGLLDEGECPKPWDLSVLADLVKTKHGDRQIELVRRLPTAAFKTASPNEGHKVAAALMVEGAIANVITLNFDLALSHALAEVGVGSEVSIVTGPEQHEQIGRSNVVYLHRSIEADPEELILTTEALEVAWADAWEEWVARWAMAAPVTVFAGLGSSCGVLRTSAEKLRSALGTTVKLLLANPGELSDSKFAKEMKIEEEDYVQLGWVEFMRALGKRFHLEVVSRIEGACKELSVREGWVDSVTNQPTEDLGQIAMQVEQIDFLSFGKVRSAWLLDTRPYPKLEEGHLTSIADLLLAVAFITRNCDLTSHFEENGEVVFSTDGLPGNRVRLVDGSSRNYRWLTLESELRQQNTYRRYGGSMGAQHVLACGVTGSKPDSVTPPKSIVGGVDDENDIVEAESTCVYWDVEEIRTDITPLQAMLA